MKLNKTGIGARLINSLDRKAIGEQLINARQIQSTPLQVRYPQGVREVLGIMSEQLSISTSDLTRILVEDALREMFLPAGNATGNIIDRVEHIMQLHDITAPVLAHGISDQASFRTRQGWSTTYRRTHCRIWPTGFMSIRTGSTAERISRFHARENGLQQLKNLKC